MATCAWCKKYYEDGTGISYSGMHFCSSSCCNAYEAQENRAEAQNQATLEAARRQAAAERDRADAERERAAALDRQTSELRQQENNRRADEVAKAEYPRYQELLKGLCEEYKPKFAEQEERFKTKRWKIDTDLRKKIIRDGKTKKCSICGEPLAVKEVTFNGWKINPLSEEDFLNKPNDGDDTASRKIIKEFDPVKVDMGYNKFRENQFDAKSGLAFHENDWKKKLEFLDKIYNADDDIIMYNPTIVQIAEETFTERKTWKVNEGYINGLKAKDVKKTAKIKFLQFIEDIKAKPDASKVESKALDSLSYSQKCGCAACHKKYLEEFTKEENDKQKQEKIEEAKAKILEKSKSLLAKAKKKSLIIIGCIAGWFLLLSIALIAEKF